MFVFFLLVASAIAAPMEDQLALPSTEDVEAVIAQLEATQAEPEEVAQVAAAVEVAQVKLTVPVVDPAPIIKPKTRVPILASRFREKALATVSAPIPKRRKLRPVNAAAAAAKIVVPAVVAPVEEVVPVVSTPVAEEVAVIAPVEDVVAVVSTPVAVEEAVVTAVAPVALKPELVASVSAPVAGKKVKKTKKNGANQRKFRPYVPAEPVPQLTAEEQLALRANDPVTLVREHSDYNIFERTYDYGFESVDGIKIVAEGAAAHKKDDEEDGTVARGSYSYPGIDGRLVVVNWVADSKGYRATSSNVKLADNEEADNKEE